MPVTELELAECSRHEADATQTTTTTSPNSIDTHRSDVLNRSQFRKEPSPEELATRLWMLRIYFCSYSVEVFLPVAFFTVAIQEGSAITCIFSETSQAAIPYTVPSIMNRHI